MSGELTQQEAVLWLCTLASPPPHHLLGTNPPVAAALGAAVPWRRPALLAPQRLALLLLPADAPYGAAHHWQVEAALRQCCAALYRCVCGGEGGRVDAWQGD